MDEINKLGIEKQKSIQRLIEFRGLDAAKKIRASLVVIGYIISEFELALQSGTPVSIDIAKAIKDYGESVNMSAIDFANYCNAIDFLDEDMIAVLSPLVEIIEREE